MKKRSLFLCALLGAVLAVSACGAQESEATDTNVIIETDEVPTADTVVEETAEETSEVTGAPYFTKGVYVNYSQEEASAPKTYFYVFNEETWGHTEDGANEGIGLPFSVEQTDGAAKFSFGGDDGIVAVFTVTSVENGVITGAFEDGIVQVFEPVAGVDPDTFSSENYVNGPENSVYHDANGWSIKYDATKFEVTQNGPEVFIVYTGEAAGSNLITVTYTIDNKGEAAIKELGKNYGDKAEYSEKPFPGADDVKGYFVSVPVDKEGSGAYMEAFARDFMDGALIFEVDGHEGNDEEMNKEVKEAITAVLDSLTF